MLLDRGQIAHVRWESQGKLSFATNQEIHIVADSERLQLNNALCAFILRMVVCSLRCRGVNELILTPQILITLTTPPWLPLQQKTSII